MGATDPGGANWCPLVGIETDVDTRVLAVTDRCHGVERGTPVPICLKRSVISGKVLILVVAGSQPRKWPFGAGNMGNDRFWKMPVYWNFQYSDFAGFFTRRGRPFPTTPNLCPLF